MVAEVTATAKRVSFIRKASVSSHGPGLNQRRPGRFFGGWERHRPAALVVGMHLPGGEVGAEVRTGMVSLAEEGPVAGFHFGVGGDLGRVSGTARVPALIVDIISVMYS
jgi:hypothetical protein